MRRFTPFHSSGRRPYPAPVHIPPPPPHARAGLDWLAAADPHLARIEAEAGPLPWRVRDAGFSGLLSAIVGQQISNQAAAAIWRRCSALPGCLAPETFLLLDQDALRAAGLSRPKIAHGRAVAEAFASGLLATDRLAALADEEAIAELSSVRGLGVWSAEIYLLFALAAERCIPGWRPGVAGRGGAFARAGRAASAGGATGGGGGLAAASGAGGAAAVALVAACYGAAWDG